MLAFLPKDDFISITRNAIVRRDKILNISHDGVYTMIDGKTFQGRTRYLSTHRKLKKEMEQNVKNAKVENLLPLSFLDKCDILNNMPVAYCVIELTFDEKAATSIPLITALTSTFSISSTHAKLSLKIISSFLLFV